MTTTLPRWVSRTAAVALLIGVLTVTYFYVIAPVLSAYRGTDEEIAQTKELLDRYESLAQMRVAYQTRLDELNSEQGGTGIYLSGATDAVAAAELQNRVKEIVNQYGGSLRSIQNLPVKSDGDFHRVAVRVQFNANLASLHRALYQLESAKPFVFVDNLDVRNRRARGRNAPEDLDPLLTIRFDLTGYLSPEAIK